MMTEKLFTISHGTLEQEKPLHQTEVLSLSCLCIQLILALKGIIRNASLSGV